VDASSARPITRSVVMFDYWLVLVVFLLMSFGLLMVASASIVISDQQLHQPFYFFYHQLIYLVFGLAIGAVIIQFDTEWWEKLGSGLLLTVIVLLTLVLIPGVGHAVNGSARWLFGMQVSELAKFVVVIYMAGYLLRHNAEVQTRFSGFVKPMIILSILAMLLLREPDFGSCVVIIATAFGMMFLAGMRLRNFLPLFILVLLVMCVVAISAPYRMHRLTGFLNPWNNPYSHGYQLTQSLIAFGRGGWFGVGLGNSIQKLFYLPESHTDFLFAVIAEELGLIGVLIIMALFCVLVTKIFLIGRKAQLLGRHFAGYMAYGFGLWIAIQFMVSIGVNCGVLPTKGLTLPLVSYGGSSMVINCLIIILVLRIDYENRVAAGWRE